MNTVKNLFKLQYTFSRNSDFTLKVNQKITVLMTIRKIVEYRTLYLICKLVHDFFNNLFFTLYITKNHRCTFIKTSLFPELFQLICGKFLRIVRCFQKNDFPVACRYIAIAVRTLIKLEPIKPAPPVTIMVIVSPPGPGTADTARIRSFSGPRQWRAAAQR